MKFQAFFENHPVLRIILRSCLFFAVFGPPAGCLSNPVSILLLFPLVMSYMVGLGPALVSGFTYGFVLALLTRSTLIAKALSNPLRYRIWPAVLGGLCGWAGVVFVTQLEMHSSKISTMDQFLPAGIISGMVCAVLSNGWILNGVVSPPKPLPIWSWVIRQLKGPQ
jgi:hypothetical protein